MPVRWDALLAAATALELGRRLQGERVRAVMMDPRSRRLILFLRSGCLALELHPTQGWVSILPASEPVSEARPLPCVLRDVTAPPDESMLVFWLARVRGRRIPTRIVVELIGNRWNSMLVEGEDPVIRSVLVPRDDRHRSLRSGSRYEPPPATGRAGADR